MASSDKESDSDDEADKNEWVGLFGILMESRTMTKTEILNSHLPFLNAIAKEIINNKPMSMGMGGIMGGSEKDITETDDSQYVDSDYLASQINSAFR